MSEIVILQGQESRTVLLAVAGQQAPAIMSYLSKDKWHVAKVTLKSLTDDKLYIEGCHASGKPHPINIRIGQPVGLNFKHAYGKFVFDTVVVGLEPSTVPDAGGTIVLAVPERVGVVQRRSYFRVNVPDSLKVTVVIWHRSGSRQVREPMHNYYESRLMDLSAGGAQVVVPVRNGKTESAPGAGAFEFHKGQFVGVRFTPLPFETPLVFNAQIRNILPTADHSALCLGLQIVGLEASEDGRQTLARIATVVERYYDMNQASGKQQGTQVSMQADQQAFHVPAEAFE
ncbi:MAG: PilZ domain-containing protein [Sedimentisphaerales bacterium]|nr:PilZ domain-containing protein [Sedimentisphaerales bacterium]